MAIVEADEQLRQSTGRAMFGSDEYYVSFVGEPSTTAPWLLQFGGHHLALNITLAGDQGTLAPSHTAAQPATYELEGRTVQPLGREVELSAALLAVARRAATRAGHSRLSSARSRARPGSRRPDDPARRHQRLGADGAPTRAAARAGRRVDWHFARQLWRARSERSSKRTSKTRGSPGAVRPRQGSRPTFASKGRPCISSMRRKAETIRRRTSTRSTAIRPTSTALAGGRGSAARRPAARARGSTVGGARSSTRRVPAGDGRQHRA